MTKQEAKSFKNFGWKEESLHGIPIFEKYELISYPFMKWVDEMVSYAKEIYGDKAIFYVYDINSLKHKKDSYHYAVNEHLSMAIDGVFKGLSPLESFIVFSKFGFKTTGFYPDWKPYAGFHIDMRPIRYCLYWIARKIGNKQVYNYDFKKFVDTIGEYC